MADADETNKNSPEISHDKEDNKLTREEYQLKKRLPRKLPRRPNDVYVNKKTNFKVCFHMVFIETLFVKIIK